MTSGQTILYKCLFCDFASTKRAALAGHMQRHKGKTAILAVRIDRELRDKFTDLCQQHDDMPAAYRSDQGDSQG